MQHKKRIFATTHPFFEGGDILGRTVANNGFIKALFSADPFDEYHFFLAGQPQQAALSGFFNEHFPECMRKNKIKLQLRHALPEAIKTRSYHCFHLSDSISDVVPLCALRNAISKEIFPVTGVTHSLSYARYLPDYLSQLWPGRTERDAIIVTSSAGIKALDNIFNLLIERASPNAYPARPHANPANAHQSDGKAPASGFAMSVPRMERIPLGVELSDFAAPDSEMKKTLSCSCRQSLGLNADDRVALVFGRFSHHSKMDLLPLLRVVQRAVALGLDSKRFVLILAGAMQEDDPVPQTLKELAGKIGLRLIIRPSPSAEEKAQLYAAADLFISPSDNIQETFGLTILEAGAASLPVLASDYDGYKDLVKHEETGFLIPSIGPAHSPGSNILAGVLYDNQYHLRLAQQTALDVPSFASYLVRLVNDPQLCQRLGQAGRATVENNYSWDKVIQRYLLCWEELWRSPISNAERERLRGLRHPFSPDFAQSFANYPSRVLSPDLQVRWSKAGEAVYRKQDFPIIYAGIEHLVDHEMLRRLLFQARKGCTAGDLMNFYAVSQQAGGAVPDILNEENASFIVLWALKQDLLELI